MSKMTTLPQPSTIDTARFVELNIGGMTCAACANTIERKLNRLDGIDASVNFATERALVSGIDETDADRAIEAVKKAGYSATVRTDDDDAWTERAASVRISSLRRRLAVSALLAVPVCDFTILFALVPSLRFPGWELLCILLTIPIVTWGAWPFHRSTLRNLRHGSLSMDTLVSLGSVVAFGWAIYTLLFDPALTPGYWLGFGNTPVGADAIYLDVAAGMITFQLGGRYFETRARRRAGDVLNAIGNLAAKEVRIQDADGSERIIPAAGLRVGDVFIVSPGERLPADGRIVSGHSSLDTSAMTGEPVPVEVTSGDAVIGGTFNHTGRLLVRADSVGANTRLAQMAAIAEDAQRRKAKVQTFADSVSSVFIPIVLLLAVIVTVIWLLVGVSPGQAIGNGIAVLIIACPCALGLATPTALMVYLLSYTGLRWGEATAIHVRSIDTGRRRIRIDENAVRVGTGLAIGTPKTHESRSVPVPRFLLERLLRAIEEKRPDDLVFGFANIHLLRPHAWTGWFARAVMASKAADPTFPTVTIHDLRHTAASMAISAGANVKAVQRMLGHASAAMTLDTYADLFDDDLDAVSDRLDEVRARRTAQLAQ